MFVLYAEKTQLSVQQREQVTSGSVNVYQARFGFSREWDGLVRTAVFQTGGESRSVLLDGDGKCVIPWEVLANVQDGTTRLMAGVYGVKGGNVVLPTVWANLGTIQDGAAPGEKTQPPTPGIYEQVMGELAETREAAAALSAAAEKSAAQAAGSAEASAENALLAEKAAQGAEASALRSERSAQEAEASALRSENAAQEAETSAEAAQLYAEAAGQSASAAEKSAQRSEDASGASQASERTAAASAAAAAESAATAQEYGEEAVERSLEAMEKAAAAQEQSALALQNAAAAVTAAENAASDAGSAMDATDDFRRQLSGLSDDLTAKVDGAYVENGYLYLTAGDEVAAGPLGPFSGGGGGTSASFLVTLKNLLESRVLTVSGGSVPLRVLYTSVDEDGMDDGAGVGILTVNGAAAATLSLAQGENTVDAGAYLVSGSNTVKLRAENSEGSSRTLSYTITVVSLTMTTPFDALAVYTGTVVFNYTVTGSGTKTVRFLMDGAELGAETVTSSGRSRSYAVPPQPDGAHVLEAYAEVSMDGTAVRSNVLTIGMLFVSADMTAPAILTSFSRETAIQGEILSIPYLVYDPMSETASVTLSVLGEDGTVHSSRTLTAGRERQTWTLQDYPAGRVTFRLACLSAVVDLAVEVEERSGAVEPVTDALALHFDPSGRSNLEADPAVWTDGNVSATFTGMGFTGADGWLTDTDGAAALRILPGGEVTIPFHLFAGDARASGATAEVEMATHNVRDYDTVVLSCLSGGRGFRIASQYAELRSEQSRISMQFKEDEKVRVSFVVEPRNLRRLIFVFVDGILSGAIQYPENDNFAQNPAAGLTIGAQSAGIDLYRIRLYTKGLTRREILDNYIADRPLLPDREELAQRNDIFDLAEDIVLTKLPPTLPYMVIQCPQLPQYKGDKKTCRVEYVNPADTARSFTAEGVQIDVQGTSSAGYKKKNWKLRFKSGVTCTASGEASPTYRLRPDSIPASAFCMKADVASSEGANNVELVRLYNDACPCKTPPQQADSRVRVGIDGLPCVIFWQNTETNEVRFWGKYNFNDEKSSQQVYGLTEGCESWEICNNTSDRVVFKSADFSGTAWRDDFEARYPEDSTDCTRLAAMCAWVASTDRDAAGTEEEKAARLQKFKAEFEDHFVKEPMLFYYLFTEVFLMVDSRAKNFFPTTYDGVHWLPLPYDFDTAIGINNEGQLVFDYDLEDTDQVGGSNVFNGQDSVLWRNLRDAFGEELRTMYGALRGGTLFSYAETVRRFSEHQGVWPEAVWNEDAWEKYLEPLEHDGDSAYLTMLQGSKASQREWWLYNGFRYRDSKYQCGDASASFITLRCYHVGDITVTPYSHIWPRVKYGSYTVTARGKRNQPVTLACPLDAMNDTEVYIYSADRLAAIGDLSGLQVGYANFSMAAKLQSLKLGDGSADYQNTRLTELYVGNNELLTSLDVRNCVDLAQTVDLTGCVGVETVLAKGSSVTGVSLPVGGKLKKLELPGTVTNLTIRDQAQLEELTMEGCAALATLRVENTPNVPLEDILTGAEDLDRVRLIGVEITVESEVVLHGIVTKLKGCIGLDAAGNNTAQAVVTGKVLVPSISPELLAEINEAFPQLIVVAGGEPQYIVRYLDWDNTVLYRAVVSEGDDAVNVVTVGYIDAPEREGTDDTGYTFRDFGALPKDIHSSVTLTAQYDITYRVQFINGENIYATQWVKAGENAAAPAGTPVRASTAQNTFSFVGWSCTQDSIAADTDALSSITGPRTLYAAYSVTGRTYTVKFFNGSTLLQTVQNVPYGGTAKYTGATPISSDGSVEDYPFEGWDPAPSNIQSNTDCRAVFGSPVEVKEIEDSWDEIIAACADGSYKTKYKLGNYKPLDMGTEGAINMQIVGKDVDTLADGNGVAPLSWIGIELLKTRRRMNPAYVGGAPKVIYIGGTYKWAAVEGAANKFQSTNQSERNTDSQGLWVITPSSEGTLTLNWTVDSGNRDILNIYVDGANKLSTGGTSQSGSIAVDMTANKIVTVFVSREKVESTGIGTDTATIELSATVEITIEEGTEGTLIVPPVPPTKGAIGGWEKSEMRNYFKQTLKMLISENIRSAIVTVRKSQISYEHNGNGGTKFAIQTTQDDVWMPSYDEMSAAASTENQPRYKEIFPDENSREKSSEYWTRTALAGPTYITVHGGKRGFSLASEKCFILFGFCT